jgi:uncharacterized protein (TIGR03790 family)
LCRAGGGPENLFLLVNENSAASKTIANYYVDLRQLPPSHVLYLNWTGNVEATDVETFRQQILQPALESIRDRGLGEQIDYLVYSSDFPWLVDLKKDFGERKLPAQLAPTASLTGVTYLWQLVAAHNQNVVGLRNNLYVQWPSGESKTTESHGFRSWYGWSDTGQPLEAGGSGYLLSTMLAVTSGRGNSLPEVISYLMRSAEADGTQPRGTIYYMRNGNVRSTTRQPGFAPAVAELKELGVLAEVLNGTVPSDRNDVQGLMAGSSDFDWSATGSKIKPGALCEHLTSFGGVLRANASQTPLSVFLRYGAAGATGTITEPYAIGDKFPLPSVQVHYARGCTLAEACYQSVAGPYQLLVVGDPLCRPWAEIPTVVVEGVTHGEKLAGTVELLPQVRSDVRVDRFELFVDGQRTARVVAGQKLTLETRTLVDGYHELRIVGIAAGAIATQGRAIVPVVVANRGKRVELTGPGLSAIGANEKFSVLVKAVDATAIAIMHNGRIVGRLASDTGSIEIDAAQLGSGPVTLSAVAIGGQAVQSVPLHATIELPE